MNRVNIFNQIHKGLRAMLYNMALTIQHTDFGKDEEGRATLRKLKLVLELYAEHGGHEDALVFPPVHKASPAAVAALEAEHDKDELLSNDLLLLIRAYKSANSDSERLATGYAIHLAFQEFVAFNLQHMVKEETVINPLLWENYTDEQIMEIQQRVLRNIPPQSGEHYTRWILRGLNDAELAEWFEKVKATAPPEIWAGLRQLATEELGSEKTAFLLLQES
ncbi:MAG TPA: hemerythrin domain-containing protein [Chitinophagaceae bacterium]|nr:hemerythrin domain-containing protein [Chitinophagaceae bacterium]